MQSAAIQVRVAELRQLFDQMDPSPFGERDLDPKAEAFIVGWAEEVPRAAPLTLVVHVGRPAGPAEEAAALSDAIRRFFGERSHAIKRELRQLFHRGRISLVIGLLFLSVMIGVGDLIATAMSGGRLGEILRESLLIGGWVAMWRPLEVFLYAWWPIRARTRLYDRLSEITVRLVHSEAGATDAWRRDWPAGV